MLNELGLFAGINGIGLGLERAGLSHPVCFVEKDAYCQKVLALRYPEVPIWDDVTTFDGKPWQGKIDIISGGFPCQDISVAGKGAGIEGSRSGLWSEFCRIIGEIRPLFAVIENVPMLTVRGGTRVIGDLAEIGYNAEWTIISAAGMGAPHLRKRIFILSYPQCDGRTGSEIARSSEKTIREEPQRQEGAFNTAGTGCISETARNVADTKSKRLEGQPGNERERRLCLITQESIYRRETWWTTEPNVGRVAHGIPSRVDRLKCLGNAVVPQCAEYIGRLIMESLTR